MQCKRYHLKIQCKVFSFTLNQMPVSHVQVNPVPASHVKVNSMSASAFKVNTASSGKNHLWTPILFNYIHLLLSLGGLYPGARHPQNGGGNSTLRLQLKRIVSLAGIAILTGYVSISGYTLYSRLTTAQDFGTLVVFCVIGLINLLLSVVCSWVFPKELLELEKNICKYEEEFTISKRMEKMSKKMRASAFGLIIFIILACPTMVYRRKDSRVLECDMYLMCDIEGRLFYAMCGFISCYFLVNAFQQMSYMFMFVFLSMFLQKELSTVTTDIKKLVISKRENDDLTSNTIAALGQGQFEMASTTKQRTATQIDPESTFKMLSNRHERICQILINANSCVKHFTFLGLFMSIPVNCSLLYTTLIGSNSGDINLWFLILSNIVFVTIRLFMMARVCTKAHCPLPYLWKLRKVMKTDEGMGNLKVFIKRLTSGTIGFDVFGLLTINMPTLLGIFGTFTTYLVVVIQFRPTGTEVCDSLLRNITRCNCTE